MGGDLKELDYLNVLKALVDIPFNVGKKLLVDFLQGNASNESIERNKLKSKTSFGSMAYDDDEINKLIDSLVLNDMVRLTSVNGKKFWKVLEITPKGINEIKKPTLYKRKLAYNFKESTTVITDEDKLIFKALNPFLEKYNDAQKKAIISKKESILCIAGAGSGKTTVLTKRIEFLAKYRSVDQKKILAITFTRKARQEMQDRLLKLGALDYVMVETFNSYCEEILKNHNDVVYDVPVRVISYRDKILILNKSLSRLGTDMHNAIDTYFSFSQKRGKTPEQLSNIFLNDCFFIRDYFKFKNKPIIKSSFDIAGFEHQKSLNLVIDVCNYIEEYMSRHGLRDFADQLIDAIALFENHKELIPQFDHVLIDEYQDINSTQIKLIDLLSPKNLFCVGDPRQSIYGWRGSDIRYILNFEEKYQSAQIITLTKNYRSTKHIVDFINKSIQSMGLADLDSSIEGEKDIRLIGFDNEMAEFEFVIQRILASDLDRDQIFVLARTNKQLNELSQNMKLRKIKHVLRSDETRKTILAKKDDITLATIHAIKGLEAEMVFVIGATPFNFPCKGSEHPVIDMVKVEEYDKEEEERRLFYVAMSRAKKNLYVTYSGSRLTSFITNEMMQTLDASSKVKPIKPLALAEFKPNKMSNDLIDRLKEWRRRLSQQMNVPAYMVMHDKTLIELSQKMPMDTSDLHDIQGLGPTKIMKYGNELIDLING